MMNELELLKKDWKNQDNYLPHVKVDKLYGMIHKRSSSLTRWILVIAIAEFIFWIGLTFINSTENSLEKLRQLHFYEANIILTGLNFVVILFFILLLYKNYKKIKSTDSARQLMKKILKVRKTVNYYVIYNLVMLFVSTIMVMTAMYFYDPMTQKVLLRYQEENSNIGSWGLLFLSTAFVLILLVIFWLFYRLIYGIFLRSLLKNYRELNKFDFENE